MYCSTRRRTQEMAEFLQEKGVRAGYYHGGMSPELKKDGQEGFINGELQVIAATNAFGMGIDKPGRSARSSCGHPRLAGELFAGSQARRTRQGLGALCAALHI